MKTIKQYKYIIVIISLLVLGAIFYGLYFETDKKNEDAQSGTVDPDKIMDAIKYLESANPPILDQLQTEEDVVNNPHIKQIRLALNGYLDGTNNGLEEYMALDVTDPIMKCGLNNFDKTYYQSKFVILSARDNEYGGILAYIAFVDKPDTMFFVWIYGVVGEQRLRTFCETPAPEDDIDGYKEYINKGINDSNYRL